MHLIKTAKPILGFTVLLIGMAFLSCEIAYSDIDFSGTAYNETSLINNKGDLRYGNRNALHLRAESLTQGIKMVSEMEFYTIYGYLSSSLSISSISPMVSEFLKDGQFYVDRLYMKFPIRSVDLVIGKQRIAWGSGIIFRPTDSFNKPNPLSLSGRREGVNAILTKAFMGDLSSVEFVIASLGDSDRTNDQVNPGQLKYSKIGTRFSTNFLKTDMASSYQYDGRKKDHIFGLDTKGDLKLGYHLEATFTYNKDSFKSEDMAKYFQAVFGLDYSFQGKWILLGEYLYNGRGAKDEVILSPIDFSLIEDFKYRHYIYFQLAYQPDIFLGANVFALWNAVDKSLIISPGINYSFFQNTDLQLYSQIFLGDETDEYGAKRLGINQVYYLKLIVKF